MTMKLSLKILGLASAAAFVFSVSAQAQTTTYNGNGTNGFGPAGGGPVGDGMLTLTSDGTTLSGTIAPGLNNGAGANGQLYDELVIYISTDGVTGFTSTASLTDTTTDNTILAEAVSGYNGTKRATVNFASGFAADYALAISPTQAGTGELFGLTSAGTFTALQSLSLTPTGAGNPDYTFNFTLANIGVTSGFQFSTTYLNAHGDIYRSNEAFNTITDTTTPSNTGNIANDTAALGVDVFGTPTTIPEPSTWALMLGGIGMLVGFRRVLRRA